MQIKNAVFVKSAVSPNDWPEASLPQIALVGRSNVGKSSLINCLANNYKLARTSNIPGKTRLLNFYLFNESFYLVDLPGYGYANVSHSEKDKWSDMIDGYLTRVPNLALIIQILDIRHTPSTEDVQMSGWINHFGFKTAIVASKADKLSKSSVNQNLKDIRTTLDLRNDISLIPFSYRTGQGKDELLTIMDIISV